MGRAQENRRAVREYLGGKRLAQELFNAHYVDPERKPVVEPRSQLQMALRVCLGVMVAAVLSLILAALMGCQPPVSAGTVVGRHFTPAHTDIELETSIDADGNTTITPVVEHYPDKWTVTICNEDGRSQQWTVTKQVYDSAHVGHWVSDIRRGIVTETAER